MSDKGEKKKTKAATKKKVNKEPYVVKVLRAVKDLQDDSGTGRLSILKYLRDHVPEEVTDNQLRNYVTVAIQKGLKEGYLKTRVGHKKTYLVSVVGKKFLKEYKGGMKTKRESAKSHKEKDDKSPSPKKRKDKKSEEGKKDEKEKKDKKKKDEKEKKSKKSSSSSEKDKKKRKKKEEKSPSSSKKKRSESPSSSAKKGKTKKAETPSSSSKKKTSIKTRSSKKSDDESKKGKRKKSVKRSLASAFEEAAKEGEDEAHKEMSPSSKKRKSTPRKGKGKDKEKEPGDGKKPARKPAQPRKKKVPAAATASEKDVSSTVVAPEITMNGVAFNTTDLPDIRADVQSIIKTLLQDDSVGVGIIANRGAGDGGNYKLDLLNFCDDFNKINEFIDNSYGEGSEWLAYYRMVLESAKDLLWAKCKTRTLILVGHHSTEVLNDKSLEALTYKLELLGVRVFGFHHSQLELLQQLIINNELR